MDMNYQHRWLNGDDVVWAPGKAVCVGRNYLDHIRELGNAVPTRPVIFMKPNTAFSSLEAGVVLPQGLGSCHHEVELTLLIGDRLRAANPEDALAAVAGYGIGLDLTLRELQDELKAKGQPWELAKAFDGSAPLSPFIPAAGFDDPANVMLRLTVNGEVRQEASTALMMTRIPELLAFISSHFTLLPGDVVFTGTPAGVAALGSGDALILDLAQRFRFQAKVL